MLILFRREEAAARTCTDDLKRCDSFRIDFEAAIDWLRTPRSYGMPEDPVQLLVKLPADYYYVNGAKGTLEVRRDGRFRVPVNLFRREPGLYTIMLWLKRNEKEPSFPATQICIRCE